MFVCSTGSDPTVQSSIAHMVEDKQASNQEFSAPIMTFPQSPTATSEDNDDASVAEIEMQERVS